MEIINSLDPRNVNWSDTTNAISYVALVLLLLAGIFILFFLIRNIKKILLFFQDTLRELKKVDWLRRSKLINYSTTTLIMILFAVLFILAFDQLFLALRNFIIVP